MLTVDASSLLTETITDDISCMCHASMPRIARVQLRRRRNVQQEVTQRGLQSIKGKVEEIESDYCKANRGILNLTKKFS